MSRSPVRTVTWNPTSPRVASANSGCSGRVIPPSKMMQASAPRTTVEGRPTRERGADARIGVDGGLTRPEQPEFALATRGLVGFHVTVRTGERDMHSGYYGGAALNAIHVLVQGLSALLARDGLLRDQLRVGRTALSDVEVASLKKLPSGAEILLDAGATPLDPQAERDFYDRTWA